MALMGSVVARNHVIRFINPVRPDNKELLLTLANGRGGGFFLRASQARLCILSIPITITNPRANSADRQTCRHRVTGRFLPYISACRCFKYFPLGMAKNGHVRVFATNGRVIANDHHL